jgi:PAS domain S-box-containing protein
MLECSAAHRASPKRLDSGSQGGGRVKTVFIGGGQGCRAVLEMFLQGRLQVLDLEILAVVDVQPDAPGMRLASEQGWPTLGEIEQALALPGVELVIELTGQDEVLARIYRHLPSGARLMDHVLAQVFWDLEKANVNLQEILDTLPDVVMVLDPGMRIIRVNRRFEELTGKRREQMRGQTCQEIFCLGPDQFNSEDHKRAFDAVMATRHPYTVIQKSSDRPDAAHFQITSQPIFNEAREITRVVQTSREITEQVLLKRETEEAERRFRQIINAVHGIITIKDLLGRYWMVNPRAEALYKLDQAQMLGKTDEQLFEPDVAALMRRNDEHALSRGGHHLTEEKVRYEGRERVLISERLPLTDYASQVVGICLVARDVTMELELQNELISAERLAAIGKLSAGVAHELNNPLTGILTFAEDLLEESDSADPRREDYQVIVNETLRCRRIVQDLLDFSRQKAPESRHMQINQVVERVLKMIERQASFHNVAFQLEMDPALPEIEIDPNQIQQAILNLVINARDAMDANGQIRISSKVDPDRDAVVLEVRDAGCGIHPDLLQKVFEPFYSTKGERGNGLGLPAVSSVMEQHNGQVEVDSELGKGSAFRLVFPLA